MKGIIKTHHLWWMRWWRLEAGNLATCALQQYKVEMGPLSGCLPRQSMYHSIGGLGAGQRAFKWPLSIDISLHGDLPSYPPVFWSYILYALAYLACHCHSLTVGPLELILWGREVLPASILGTPKRSLGGWSHSVICLSWMPCQKKKSSVCAVLSLCSVVLSSITLKQLGTRVRQLAEINLIPHITISSSHQPPFPSIFSSPSRKLSCLFFGWECTGWCRLGVRGKKIACRMARRIIT